jgi:hypothetical protein
MFIILALNVDFGPCRAHVALVFARPKIFCDIGRPVSPAYLEVPIDPARLLLPRYIGC